MQSIQVRHLTDLCTSALCSQVGSALTSALPEQNPAEPQTHLWGWLSTPSPSCRHSTTSLQGRAACESPAQPAASDSVRLSAQWGLLQHGATGRCRLPEMRQFTQMHSSEHRGTKELPELLQLQTTGDPARTLGCLLLPGNAALSDTRKACCTSHSLHPTSATLRADLW